MRKAKDPEPEPIVVRPKTAREIRVERYKRRFPDYGSKWEKATGQEPPDPHAVIHEEVKE